MQVLKYENLQQRIACFGDLTATADEIGEAGIQVFLKVLTLKLFSCLALAMQCLLDLSFLQTSSRLW